MQSPTQSKLFFTTLDAIRGVAAVLVMMRHVPYFAKFQESYLAVDVFFLLSGVVIANAYEQRLLQGLSIRRFTLMRVIRIYPLYLLGCALTLVALYADGMPAWQPLLTMIVLAGLLLPDLARDPPFPLNHPAWSLFFELLANVFYGALVSRLSTRRLLILIATSALGLGVILLKSRHTSLDFGWTRSTLLFGIFRVAYSFFAGVLLYRYFVLYSRPVVRILAGRSGLMQGLPWLIVAAIAAILMAGPAPAWHPYFDFIVVVAVFPSLIYLALCMPEKCYGASLARYLGLVSYPLYALHVPLYRLTVSFLEPRMDNDSPWLAVIFAVGLVLSCSLVNRYFDTPVRRRLMAYAEAGYTRLGRSKAAPAQDQ